MSRLTDLKDSVLESAAQARGQWTPDPDSRHYQMYVDFHKRKHIRVPKRGRCEYFHKVIRQAFYEARWIFLAALLVLLSAGLVYLFLTYPANMLTIVLGIALAVYLAFGMLLSAQITERIAPDLVEVPIPMRWYDKLPIVLQVVLGVLAIPAALALAILLAVIGILYGIMMLVALLATVVEKPARWFLFEQPFGKRGFIWIRPWVIAAFIAVAAACVFVPGFLQFIYLPVLAFVGMVLVVIGALFLASLIDTHKRANKEAREDSYDAALTAYIANGAVRQLFAFQHPEWVTDGVPDAKRYAGWLARYDASCMKKRGRPYDQLDFWSHMEHIDTNEYFARFGESLASLETWLRYEFTNSHPHPRTIQQRHWYHVVIELMAVAWAGLRAAKQRVCPIVIYPPGDESA